MKTILPIVLLFIFQLGKAQDWQQVGGGIDGNVICMTELDGKIYVGGNYAGDLNYISQWDPAAQQWTDISNGFITFAVMGLYAHEGKLYASGLYQWASGDIIASYDPATSQWQGLGNADNLGAISEIYVESNMIYVGGNGYSKKSEIGSGIWEDMAADNNAAQVRGFAKANGTLYVHKVETADLWGEHSMLSYNESTDEFTGLAVEALTYNWFQDLEVVGTDIYCAGSFYIDTDFQRIAVYDTETNTYSGLPGCPENVSYTAVHHNGFVYFGGGFQSPYNHVVRYNISDGSWAQVGDGINAYVSDMVILDDTLYAIGGFDDPILHVAKFDLNSIVEVNEVAKEELLSVYPNPCSDYLMLDQTNSQGYVKLVDVYGKVILRQYNTNNRIDTSNLAKGCYTLVSENDGRSILVLKM
jgi:Secretion system C-terminal sorting domain